MSTTLEAPLEVQESIVYRRYEGGLVQVVRIVEDDKTCENMVVYSELSNPCNWKVSSFDDFTEQVLEDGRTVPRHVRTDTVIGSIGGLVLAR
jgi:hypothetical protein